MHLFRQASTLALASICAYSVVKAEEVPPSGSPYSLATDIADCYTRSFPSEGSSTEMPLKNQKAHETRPAHLGAKAKREVAFNRIFAKSHHYALLQQQMAPILNEYAWADLNLFYGTTATPAYHLMSRINSATTLLGEGVLATMLVTPTSNIAELKHRQSLIKAFLDSPEEVAQLKRSLQAYQEAEESLFSLWTPSDPLYTKEYKRYMSKRFYSKKDGKGNKSAGWLELKKRFFRDFMGIQFKFLYPAILPLGGEIFNRKGMREVGPFGAKTTRRFAWTGAIPYYGGWYRWNRAKKNEPESAKTFLILGILYEAYYTYNAYTGIRNYQEYSSVLRNLALRMADVQAFVVAATQVSEQIAASPKLEERYGPRLTNIRALLAKSQEKTELGQLMHYLQTCPYRRWSYFFNNAGKLLASHKLFTEHKDAFADAMYELGELDAFVSITTLIQEAEASEASHAYVFTQFLDRSKKKKPYIKLEDMWNPFLDAHVAVGNSVEMDAAGGVRNIILTGPNAGGKSTFLTGVTTSLLLSQTFGIAPAKEAVMTPFDKINTYIDVTDDIAAGKSLFMAEVDRAQKHLRTLAELQQDEFSFTIFDEPFSGTNPTEGAAAEYSILESIADYTNTMNIVATHYPIVMLLEKNAPTKGFANYKVYITHEKGQKKINYTYKVMPGKSNQAIAIDILEEQGYDTRMLKRAREIIEHPERYEAKF